MHLLIYMHELKVTCLKCLFLKMHTGYDIIANIATCIVCIVMGSSKLYLLKAIYGHMVRFCV